MKESETAAWVGLSIWDEAVPSPLVYVDTDVLGRNLRTMAAAAQASGVGLRPHTKTHKLAEIARLQLEAGALGLTVAKTAEARAFADAGIVASFMVAQPYTGATRVDWQLELAERCEVIACVDSLELARSLGNAAAARGGALELVLIVDTGYGRFGVPPAEAPALAEAIAALAGVRFRGIRSHSGLAYDATTTDARRELAAADASAMAEVAERIRAAGVPCDIVSVGSTPGTAGLADATTFAGTTEWRPGNYAFFDRMQVSLGAATVADCALRVVASVVSAAGPGRAVIDAGRKTLTATLDPGSQGHGLVLGRDAEIVSLSEECGWVRYAGDALEVGERLEVVPNHACELTNLAEVVAYGTGGRIDGFWQPVARGKVW